MKLIVTAKWLSLAKTSEGICTSKTIYALAQAGHDIVCLTSDPTFADEKAWFNLPWLADVPVRHIDSFQANPDIFVRLDKITTAAGKIGRLVHYKIGAAIAYLSGFKTEFWKEVTRWKQALLITATQFNPDWLLIRGAGVGFEPHIAMLQWQSPVPWIAHYHDPFPDSLYPEPYRQQIPLISDHQEALHRQIIERADALTFPSHRLLEWVLDASLSCQRRKAFVIPHLGLELPSITQDQYAPPTFNLAADKFNILHTGTLTGPRTPWALLEGFTRFVAESPEKRRDAKLTLVGNVNGLHLANKQWQQFSQPETVELIDQRLSYHHSLELIRQATVAVVIEAPGTESPFFPAKLADYIWLGKPILSLSPVNSVVTDMLGQDYPLIVPPNNPAAVAQALNLLWERWRQRELTTFRPGQQLLQAISAQTAVTEFERIFARQTKQTLVPVNAA